MTTITENRSARTAKEFDSSSTPSEFAIGFIWLAFYLVAVVVAIVSPIISTSIEIASFN